MSGSGLRAAIPPSFIDSLVTLSGAPAGTMALVQSSGAVKVPRIEAATLGVR
jgi:hypothetical protein